MTGGKASFAGGALWAVLDYGLFALAGMVASVLLARGLSPHEYGAYSFSFAVYIGVFLLHGAIFAEPMLVLLAHRFRDQRGSYLRALLAAHGLFSIAAVAVLGLFALAAGGQLRGALLWMALATPFMNLAQLLRRICYALWSPRAAAAGAGVYLLLLSAAVLGLDRLQLLGVGSAYAAFAGSSLLVSSTWLYRAFTEPSGEGAPALTLSDVARAHFGIARFGVGTALLSWIPLNLWYVVLPWVAPDAQALSASGHLRALVNLMQPMLQVNGALATALYPAFTRQLAHDPRASPWRYTAGIVGLSALYAPALALLGEHADRLLYRGAYPADPLTLWALGAAPACFGLYSSLRAFSVASTRPQLPLAAASVGAVACLTGGIALCAWNPLTGSALALLLGHAVQGCALAWLVQRRSTDLAFSSPSRAA